ncbi:MAG: NUDIX hydrolase, partial [Planctomycetaceae bacterium]
MSASSQPAAAKPRSAGTVSSTATGSSTGTPVTGGQRAVLAQGRYLALIREGSWEYAARAEGLGAVVIVPVTPAGELVLVEQYRVPVASQVLELPAGLVGDIPGEPTDNYELQARRELLEETGFAARRLKRLVEGPVSAGFGTERVEFWLATGLTRVHAGGGVEHEQIRVHVVALAKLPAWLERQRRRGTLVDLRVYAGLWFAERSLRSRGKPPAKPRQPRAGARKPKSPSAKKVGPA